MLIKTLLLSFFLLLLNAESDKFDVLRKVSLYNSTRNIEYKPSEKELQIAYDYAAQSTGFQQKNYSYFVSKDKILMGYGSFVYVYKIDLPKEKIAEVRVKTAVIQLFEENGLLIIGSYCNGNGIHVYKDLTNRLFEDFRDGGSRGYCSFFLSPNREFLAYLFGNFWTRKTELNIVDRNYKNVLRISENLGAIKHLGFNQSNQYVIFKGIVLNEDWSKEKIKSFWMDSYSFQTASKLFKLTNSEKYPFSLGERYLYNGGFENLISYSVSNKQFVIH